MPVRRRTTPPRSAARGEGWLPRPGVRAPRRGERAWGTHFRHPRIEVASAARGRGSGPRARRRKPQDGGRAQGGWRRLAIARRETTTTTNTTTRTGRRPGARLGVYLMVVLYLWSLADGDRAPGGSLEERACRVDGWR